jgi:hypothetical protein
MIIVASLTIRGTATGVSLPRVRKSYANPGTRIDWTMVQYGMGIEVPATVEALGGYRQRPSKSELPNL